MADSELVSVVVPAYNASATVVEAIESVLNQTYKNLEIIVCDDASSDNTVDAVNQLTDSRITLLKNDRNLGEGPTRDRAIEIARGGWVAVLDADDAWEPDRLEVLMSVARVHPDCMVADELMECHHTSNGLVPWRPVRGWDAFGGGGEKAREVSFPDFIRCKRTLIKPIIPIRAIRAFGVRHSTRKFGEDLEFFLKLFSRNIRLWYVPKPMYLYRISFGAMSALPQRYSLLREVMEDAMGWFSENPEDLLALTSKLSVVARIETYQGFYSALMAGRFRRAGQKAWSDPWVLGEFLKRSWGRLPYHVHRVFHRGVRRGTVRID